MKSKDVKQTRTAWKVVHLVVSIVLAVAFSQSALGQTFNLLYSFAGGKNDGQAPYSGLVADKKGNYYGTTQDGGATGNGTAFELSPAAGGGWNYSVIFNFSGWDGSIPIGRLAIDASGNLYGTTYVGGNSGNGNVFELSNSGGVWSAMQLYQFTGNTDGALPYAGLLLVSAKDGTTTLYGTTESGGNNDGVVFQLTKPPAGGWTYKVLYSFLGNVDGAVPNSALVRDSSGTLFGTTTLGGYQLQPCGQMGCGTIFAVTQGGKETVLYRFLGVPDGAWPYAQLFLKPCKHPNKCNLYGTTYGGGTSQNCPGSSGCGSVFTIKENGTFYTSLYSFQGLSDGSNPYAGLVHDRAGNLYGTTIGGGPSSGGTIYKLAARNYTNESVVYAFTGTDGGAPTSDLLAVGAGTPTLYGTTQRGGAHLDGVLFSLVP